MLKQPDKQGPANGHGPRPKFTCRASLATIRAILTLTPTRVTARTTAFGVDLVHLHYPFFGGAEPTVGRKASKGDHALVLSYYMDAAAGGVKSLIFNAHRRLLLPWIPSHADRLLVSSFDYARHSALARIEGARDRLEAHPFGVDVDRFHPGTELALWASLGIAPDAPVVLFVGGLDPAHHFKGFPVLVDALHGLHDLPWHLVVVGDGTLRARFEALVHSRRTWWPAGTT